MLSPQPGVRRYLLDHELSDIGARYLAAVNAREVGGGPDAATRWVVSKHSGADEDPVERTGADRGFLAALVLVGGAEQQRLEQPVEDEAAVAATVADSERGDAYKPADAGAGHRGDEGPGRDGQQVDLAEAHTGAQRTDDGIAAVQSAHEGRLVARFALYQLGPWQVGARFRTNQRYYVVTALRGVADDELTGAAGCAQNQYLLV